MSGRVHAWPAHVAALLGYGLLTVVMTWPLAGQVTTAIPGDSFDGWQNYWNLWWVKVALVDRLQNPYFTDLLYHPTGVGLYFHTLNPFNGLATLPVQLSAGLIPAYNTVVLISWVLAGYGVFLLTLWVVGKRSDAGYVAAFLAGLVFTFAPVHMAHLLGHMQVMALQWLPFYGLALLRGVTAAQVGRPWGRAGAFAGLFLVLAGLCDWYFVLYLFLFTGLVLVWAWMRRTGMRGAAVATWLAPLGPPVLAGVIFAGVLAPILAPMVLEAVRFSFMVRPSSDLYVLSASLADFVIPNRLHTLFRPDSFTWPGNQVAPVSERTIAVGYAALVAAVVGIVTAPGRGRLVWLWSMGAVFFVLMAMGPRLHVGNIDWAQIPGGAAAIRGSVAHDDASIAPREWSPYALVNTLVPFMRISRSVSRFAIMVQLCVAVLAGVGLAWGLARVRRRMPLVGLVVAGLILAEYWVAPYPTSPPDTPAFYARLSAPFADAGGQALCAGCTALLNLPMNYDRPGYLLYQTVHQRPLTVAYISRDDPRTLTERVPFLQHLRHLGPDILDVDPAAVGQTVLRDLGVAWVVLDRYKMPGGAEREVTTRLVLEVFSGVIPFYEDERITVFGVPPGEVAQPYLALGPLHWGPLRMDGEARYRTLGDGPAEIILQHVAPGTRVAIRYRSADDGALEVTVDGERLRYPAAPVEATILLAPMEERLVLLAVGRVDILEIGLVTSP